MSSIAGLNRNNRRYIAYRPCPDMRGQDHVTPESVAGGYVVASIAFCMTFAFDVDAKPVVSVGSTRI